MTSVVSFSSDYITQYYVNILIKLFNFFSSICTICNVVFTISTNYVLTYKKYLKKKIEFNVFNLIYLVQT